MTADDGRTSMNDRNVLKVFQGILSSHSFELLSEFSSEARWSSLKQEEKEMLSQLFLLHGEHCIASTPKNLFCIQAKEAFLSACRITPKSAKAHFRLGSFLATSDQEADIEEAIRLLKHSISLDNRFFDSHYALACVLLRIGSKKEDEEVIQHAQASFMQAHCLFEEECRDTIPAEFYWHWGLCLFLLGRVSGEPSDFKEALLLYQKAYEKGLSHVDFLNDYANGLVELSLLIDHLDYIERAAFLYEESSVGASLFSETMRLFNAACCWEYLYERTFEAHTFEESEKLFLKVLLLEPIEQVYQKMGQLYFLSARATLQEDSVRRAIECFRKALALGLDHPVMLAYYAQTLLLLFEKESDPRVLQEAVSFAKKAMHEARRGSIHSAEPWLALIRALYEQGIYFDELSYYRQANEVLHEALRHYPKNAYLWHAFALLKARLADYEKPEEHLQEAAISFLFASRSVLGRFAHFWNDWGIVLLGLADLSENQILAEEACLKFETAIQLSGLEGLDWMYNLGCAFDLLGLLRDEEEWFERAIDLFAFVEQEDSTIPGTLLQQAIAYIHLGDRTDEAQYFERAEHLLHHHLAQEKEDELAWIELGLVSLRLADTHESNEDRTSWSKYQCAAEEAFTCALYLGSEQAYYYLACHASILGNYPEAMEYLWKADEAHSLPELRDLLDEEWLAPLMETKPFQQFMRELVESYSIPDGALDET